MLQLERTGTLPQYFVVCLAALSPTRLTWQSALPCEMAEVMQMRMANMCTCTAGRFLQDSKKVFNFL